MKTKIFYIIILLLPFLTFSQEMLKGRVIVDQEGQRVGLEGATAYWLDTQIGGTTDEEGRFQITYKPEYRKLVISYVGYKTDTMNVYENVEIVHRLREGNELDEINLESRRKTRFVSVLGTSNVSRISHDELLKAACCNLSESFETNPSIDVNFSDAITGKKQINMLGLDSPYILITQENIPSVRGASQAYGLTFIPGTWVESIQISKGTGSVVNGYESIAGQINTELVKPFSDKKLFVNLYGSTNGRLEFNTHFNQIISDKWSGGIYIHGNNRSKKMDGNNDNFLDLPLAKQINVMNRWQYQNLEKGWVSFLNLRYLHDEKQAGEMDFDPNIDKFTTNSWGSEIKTKRFDTSLKLGYVFPEMPYQSIGFQTSYSMHSQDAYYGLRIFDIDHKSLYSSLIFNSIIGDTRSKFKTGLTFTYDSYDEIVDVIQLERNENSIGGFFEYSFDNLDDFSLIAGIRADIHNKLGFFITPRLHLRYSPWEKSALRASIGIGRRSASFIAENQELFASNRRINIIEDGGNIYGLDAESAWNFGVSFVQRFTLFEREGDVIVDFYRTNFTNQVVVDWEVPTEISFYNLDGKSFANSFQIEFNYNMIKNMDLRLSYKIYNVKTDYQSGLLDKPLIPKHRFFANVGYNTEGQGKGFWKFDLTYNWIGQQRFPSTESNPIIYQRAEYTRVTNLLNAQVTKVFSRNFELYLGGVNIANYTQDNPIISADDPFGEYFDSTLIYAPIHGASYYLGLRFNL